MTKSRGANLFILVYIVAASAFSLYYGMEQFGGYDLSPVIDLQSRLARGEIPGVDFINTIPLTMVLILKIYGSPVCGVMGFAHVVQYYLCALRLYCRDILAGSISRWKEDCHHHHDVFTNAGDQPYLALNNFSASSD